MQENTEFATLLKAAVRDTQSVFRDHFQQQETDEGRSMANYVRPHSENGLEGYARTELWHKLPSPIQDFFISRIVWLLNSGGHKSD